MRLSNKPFFSIVTVTLNDLIGLRRTRVSIEQQSLDDFEWIVIDGESHDGTVAELQACRLPNFSCVSEKDRGLFHAMNKGSVRSRGQYVIFMNSGDRFAGPKVLEDVRHLIEATGCVPDIIYGDAFEETADSRLLLKKARPIESLNYGMHTHHQAVFYSRHSLADLSYDESFKVSADYDLTCKVYQKHGVSLAIDFPICIFLRGGTSQKRSHVGRSENWRVQRDVLGHPIGRRLLTRMAYLASFVAREKLRPIYDRLRFQHVDPSS